MTNHRPTIIEEKDLPIIPNPRAEFKYIAPFVNPDEHNMEKKELQITLPNNEKEKTMQYGDLRLQILKDMLK